MYFCLISVSCGLQVGVQQLHGDHPVDLALEIKRAEKKDHQARWGDAQDGDALLQVARGVELKDAASLEGQPELFLNLE